MVNSHPPVKLPESPGPSSNTYNDQVPLGFVLLRTAGVVPYGPAGAGAGQVVAGEWAGGFESGLETPETVCRAW